MKIFLKLLRVSFVCALAFVGVSNTFADYSADPVSEDCCSANTLYGPPYDLEPPILVEFDGTNYLWSDDPDCDGVTACDYTYIGDTGSCNPSWCSGGAGDCDCWWESDSPPVSGDPLIDLSIELASYNPSLSPGSTTITFETTNEVPDIGYILITVPAEFSVTGSISGGVTLTDDSVNIFDSATINDHEITVNPNALIAAGSIVEITLDDIVITTNPGSWDIYGFNIKTSDNSDYLDEGNYNVEIYSQLSGISVTQTGGYTAGTAVGATTFQFSTFNSIAPGEMIKIIIPEGYVINDIADLTSGCAGTCITTFDTEGGGATINSGNLIGNLITLETTGATINGGTQIEITFTSDVIDQNPPNGGDYQFQINTTSSDVWEQRFFNDATGWQPSTMNPYIAWNGLEWQLTSTSNPGTIQIYSGATWNQGYRPTKYRITKDFPGSLLIINSSGSALHSNGSVISGTEYNFELTQDMYSLRFGTVPWTPRNITNIEFYVPGSVIDKGYHTLSVTTCSNIVGFAKVIGSDELEQQFSVAKTNDGGYITASTTWGFGPDWRAIMVTKFAEDAKTEWVKVYGWDEGSYEQADSIIQTSDGGYFIVGTHYAGDQLDGSTLAMLMIKLDGNGDIEWEKTIGDISEHWTTAVVEVSTGGYVIASGSGGASLIKVDITGEVVWNTHLSGQFNSVQETIDGGFIAAGSTNNNVLVAKFDSDGSLIWHKTYDGTGNEEGHTIIEVLDGGINDGYLIAAETNSFGAGNDDALLIRTDADGNYQAGTGNCGDGTLGTTECWVKTIGTSGSEYVTSVRQANDGFIFAGKTGSYVLLMKTNTVGVPQWAKQIDAFQIGDGNGDSTSRQDSLDITNDGGYIVAAVASGYFSSADHLIVKTDSDGNCESCSVLSDIGIGSYAISPQTPTITSPLSSSTYSLSSYDAADLLVSTPALLEEYLCFECATGAPVPVDGACGSDDGLTLVSTPTNLCSVGTASAVPVTGPWTWTCYGSGGGIDDNCSADLGYIAGTITIDSITLDNNSVAESPRAIDVLLTTQNDLIVGDKIVITLPTAVDEFEVNSNVNLTVDYSSTGVTGTYVNLPGNSTAVIDNGDTTNIEITLGGVITGGYRVKIEIADGGIMMNPVIGGSYSWLVKTTDSGGSLIDESIVYNTIIRAWYKPTDTVIDFTGSSTGQTEIIENISDVEVINGQFIRTSVDTGGGLDICTGASGGNQEGAIADLSPTLSILNNALKNTVINVGDGTVFDRVVFWNKGVDSLDISDDVRWLIKHNTKVYGPNEIGSSWDGDISAIQSVTANVEGIQENYVVKVEGNNVDVLTFSEPSAIVFATTQGVPMYTNQENVESIANWDPIPTCGSVGAIATADSISGLTCPDACYIKTNDETIIWTYHLTHFGTFSMMADVALDNPTPLADPINTTFSFTNTQLIPDEGTIKITIPNSPGEFILGDGNGTVTLNAGAATVYNAVFNGNTLEIIVIDADIPAFTDITISLDNTFIETNPTTGGFYDFNIETYNGTTLLDQGVATANITNSEIQCTLVAPEMADTEQNDAMIEFNCNTLSDDLEPGEKIVITIPDSFLNFDLLDSTDIAFTSGVTLTGLGETVINSDAANSIIYTLDSIADGGTADESVAAGVDFIVQIGDTNYLTFPDVSGQYTFSVTTLDVSNEAQESGYVLLNVGNQLTLNVHVAEAINMSIDNTLINLLVDPSVNDGRDFSQKNTITVQTNALNGYAIQAKLEDSQGSANLRNGDDIISSKDIITSGEDNGFGYAAYNADVDKDQQAIINDINLGSGTNGVFINSDQLLAQTNGANEIGFSGMTNGFIHTIYYLLNVDYLVKAGDYTGTITYTVVPRF